MKSPAFRGDFTSWPTKILPTGELSLLQDVAQLHQLQWLHLGRNRISDEGLRHLAELRKLTELTVTRTEVTRAGVERLQESLPQTRIIVEPRGQ